MSIILTFTLEKIMHAKLQLKQVSRTCSMRATSNHEVANTKLFYSKNFSNYDYECGSEPRSNINQMVNDPQHVLVLRTTPFSGIDVKLNTFCTPCHGGIANFK